MNQSLAEGNDNRFSVDDYKTTVDSLINAEALVGENGALMKRIKMLRGRIEERGKQLAVEANSQYISDAIGIAIATVLYESFDNPLLYKGIGNIDVNFDMEAFQLSDIQAIKLLAAYSIQHDCDITSIDMWDLMDYAGWFDDVYTGLEISDFGLESIYQGTTETVFGSDIGGVVHVGQDATAIYQLKAPTVLFWRGNFAPQWYYEELQQIRKMNEEYYYNLNAGKTDEIAGLIPIGVTSEDDEEINTVGFTKLNTFTPYGIIDKLYTTGSATLTITHTEIEDAQIYYDEAQDQFIDSPSILDSWLAAFQTIVETTDSGNIYIRDEDGIHIYTLKNTVAGKEYYLYNPSSNTRTESISVDSDGEEIIFDHLAGDTLYEVYEVTTEVIRPEPDPTPTDPTIPPIAIESIQDTGAAQSQALTETTPAITEETAPTDATDPTEDTDPPLPEIIVTEMLIDSFVTGADLAAKKSVQTGFSVGSYLYE
ncbi:MAG: hypothetical protein IJ422_01145 [Oscillospiraceae bacterium]|nr:hypothetical protein [Oscillospiraceae bacterium]